MRYSRRVWYATLSIALLSLTLAASPAQTPAPAQAPPPSAPSADEAAARQRAAIYGCCRTGRTSPAITRTTRSCHPQPRTKSGSCSSVIRSPTDGAAGRTRSSPASLYVNRGISGQTTPQMLGALPRRRGRARAGAGGGDPCRDQRHRREHRADDDGSDPGQPGVDVRHRDRERHPRRASRRSRRRYRLPVAAERSRRRRCVR